MSNKDSSIVIYPDSEEEIDPLFAEPLPFDQGSHKEDDRWLYDFTTKVEGNQPFIQILRLLYKEVYLIESGMKPKDILTTHFNLTKLMDKSAKKLTELGYENTDIMIVRYILSTFVDELMGSIEWADGETWANHSLLSHYYKETYGGEKFFQLLGHFVKDPEKYLEHMKLVYACLSLGYKGRYSISNHTDIKIESIRQHLYERIKSHEKDKEKFYKDHPVSQLKHKLTLFVPYKFMFIGAFVIIAALYGVFTKTVMDNEAGLINTLKRENIVISTPDKDSDKIEDMVKKSLQGA